MVFVIFAGRSTGILGFRGPHTPGGGQGAVPERLLGPAPIEVELPKIIWADIENRDEDRRKNDCANDFANAGHVVLL